MVTSMEHASVRRKAIGLAALVVCVAVFHSLAAAAGDRAIPFDRILGLPAGGLDEGMKANLTPILKRICGYRGCTKTLDECLSQPEPSIHARRLAGFIVRLLKQGKTGADVDDFVKLRNYSLLSGPKQKIDLTGYPPRGAGDQVRIVLYADFECPFCGAVTPDLDRLAGEMGDRIRIYFKPWPIKNHPHAVDSAKALMAAGLQGKFWEMHDILYRNQNRLDYGAFLEYAQTIGCDMTKWRNDYPSPDLRKRIEASKREGIANGVEATPALFLNGRQYYLEPSYVELRDAIEELLDASQER